MWEDIYKKGIDINQLLLVKIATELASYVDKHMKGGNLNEVENYPLHTKIFIECYEVCLKQNKDKLFGEQPKEDEPKEDEPNEDDLFGEIDKFKSVIEEIIYRLETNYKQHRLQSYGQIIRRYIDIYQECDTIRQSLQSASESLELLRFRSIAESTGRILHRDVGINKMENLHVLLFFIIKNTIQVPKEGIIFQIKKLDRQGNTKYEPIITIKGLVGLYNKSRS